MSRIAHETVAEAAQDLAQQIAVHYGSVEAIPDDMKIRALPCPHESSDRKGVVLVVIVPGDECPTLWSYFGDQPEITATVH